MGCARAVRPLVSLFPYSRRASRVRPQRASGTPRLWCGEAVDLVGNPPPGLTTKTVAPLHRLEIEMDYKEFRNVNNSCFSAGLSSRNCPVTFAASP
jgi:hypothetical protein